MTSLCCADALHQTILCCMRPSCTPTQTIIYCETLYLHHSLPLRCCRAALALSAPSEQQMWAFIDGQWSVRPTPGATGVRPPYFEALSCFTVA